jgi:hypothetical protein
MTDFATPEDVEARLGRALTPAELARVPALLDESADLVSGHLYPLPAVTEDGVPAVVTHVVSRMVARVLQTADASGGVFGATTTTDKIGDFSQTRAFPAGANSGGPWLSKTDRQALKQIHEHGPFAVDTAPGTNTAAEHTPACAQRFGLMYCSCPPVVTP